jgi:DNA-binding NarL/FixJ family response regulator
MKRILIVEDQEHTMQRLASLLQQEFPDAVVDTAASAIHARKLVEEAAQNNPYDAAILDFKLPTKLGENPEVDESICLLLQAKASSTIVAHITGYGGDALVQKHMRRHHVESPGPSGFSLSKDKADYAIQLVRNLRRMFLEREMDDLLRGDASDQRASLRQIQFSAFTQGRGITHRLAAWTQEMSEHWHEFDDPFRAKVRTRFKVDDSRKPVTFSLL